MKNIAVFADGTWNSPETEQATNVLAMARAVSPMHVDTPQVAFYDWGVGSDGQKLMGGITGIGIDKNIMDCYRFLVHNYRPGDRIYLFGFSRGAYTVRSLAGFIRNCGMLKREHARRIPEAYDLYRQRNKNSEPGADKSVTFRKKYAVADLTPIEFVGAWDTVGALGIPVPFWGTLNERNYLFHDTEPSRIIQHARHAVSIDENRMDFEPTLWDAKPGMDLQQVWFAGVHADIGGGYKDAGLSHCAADWIRKEAETLGLGFEKHLQKQIKPDPLAPQHNERKGMYLTRRAMTREIRGAVHTSVKKRWQQNAHDYQSRSSALQRHLEACQRDWSQVNVVD
jgi:uncharacterized protein (DUF2235 family)